MWNPLMIPSEQFLHSDRFEFRIEILQFFFVFFIFKYAKMRFVPNNVKCFQICNALVYLGVVFCICITLALGKGEKHL